jgi:hypothetical protein
MSRETWHAILTICGAACEIVGLTWIVVDASRARSAEYAEYGIFRRIFNWFAFWLGPPGQTGTVHALSGTASARGGASGVLTTPDDSDIARIDRELRELRGRVEQHEAQVAETVRPRREPSR